MRIIRIYFDMKFRELERLVKEDGWVLDSSRGSHIHYVHPEKQGKITIPCHSGDIKQGTLMSILKQAGIKKGGIK